MGFRQERITWLIVTLAVSWVGEASARAQAPGTRVAESLSGMPPIPLDQLSPPMRNGVRRVLQQPTLFTHGPAEVFHGRPALYHWLLDHPDQAVRLWRRLGAKCMEITDRGNGRFGWTDGEGSEIHWDTVFESPLCRVWFAEGNVRPAPLLPAVAVRAVVVLRHAQGHDKAGAPVIHQQADLYVQTDSKTAILVTKLLGASAPRLAEQCVAQLEMFFSALVWYLDQHPEWAGTLLGRGLPSVPTPTSLCYFLPSPLTRAWLDAGTTERRLATPIAARPNFGYADE